MRLMMMTEMVPETSVPYRHLTRLIAREDFVEFSRRESSITVLGYFVLGFCILRAVSHDCETYSLTLREEHRLKVFEYRVLKRIFGPKRERVGGEVGEDCKMRSFITCTLHQILLG